MGSHGIPESVRYAGVTSEEPSRFHRDTPAAVKNFVASELRYPPRLLR